LMLKAGRRRLVLVVDPIRLRIECTQLLVPSKYCLSVCLSDCLYSLVLGDKVIDRGPKRLKHHADVVSEVETVPQHDEGSCLVKVLAQILQYLDLDHRCISVLGDITNHLDRHPSVLCGHGHEHGTRYHQAGHSHRGATRQLARCGKWMGASGSPFAGRGTAPPSRRYLQAPTDEGRRLSVRAACKREARPTGGRCRLEGRVGRHLRPVVCPLDLQQTIAAGGVRGSDSRRRRAA
jgi:hypothetical protein